MRSIQALKAADANPSVCFPLVCARQVSSAPPSAQQVRTQQASTAAEQSASMAKLFSAYDVCETSHHLQITHLDLHICDDIHVKDKGGKCTDLHALCMTNTRAQALKTDIVLSY